MQAEAQEQAQAEVDEVAERMRRLAARLQAENQRQRELADSLARRMNQGQQAQQGGGGGGGQRQLAAEADSMARQLERLARQQNSTQLQDAARQLQQAANEMRRSATGNSQAARASAQNALQQMEEARRLLDGARENGLEQATENAINQMRELQARQRQIAAETDRILGQDLNAAGRVQQERALAAQRNSSRRMLWRNETALIAWPTKHALSSATQLSRFSAPRMCCETIASKNG
jgi:hypothetical protein